MYKKFKLEFVNVSNLQFLEEGTQFDVVYSVVEDENAEHVMRHSQHTVRGLLLPAGETLTLSAIDTLVAQGAGYTKS